MFLTAFLACKPFLTPETGPRYTLGSRHPLSRSSVPGRLEIDGFDVKILKEIIKLRKQDQEERDERESMLDLYMRAMEQAGSEKVAKAA
jgi:hypothetical protein